MKFAADVAIGDLCRLSRATISPNDAEYDALPSVGLDQIETGTGAISLGPGSRSGDGRSVNFRFDGRHVLYGKLRPYLNKVALPDFAGRCSTELIPLVPEPHVDRRFLALVLRREETVRAVMAANTGSRMPRADMGVLLSLKVRLPHLAEQRRIVDILDRAASIRRLRRQAQDTARLIIPALFNKMFGDPATNSMGWPSDSLGEIIERFDGGRSMQAAEDGADAGAYRILKLSAVTSGEFRPEESKPAPRDHEPAPSHIVQRGDILITRSNTSDLVGACCLVDEKFENMLLPDLIWRIVLKTNSVVDAIYLVSFLQNPSIRPYISALATGTSDSMRKLSQGRLSTLQVLLPPRSLQHRFAVMVKQAMRVNKLHVEAMRIERLVVKSLQGRIFK